MPSEAAPNLPLHLCTGSVVIVYTVDAVGSGAGNFARDPLGRAGNDSQVLYSMCDVTAGQRPYPPLIHNRNRRRVVVRAGIRRSSDF